MSEPTFRKRVGACSACGVVLDGLTRYTASLRYTSKDVQVETVCLDCAQMLLAELPDLFADTPWAELRVTIRAPK